jgi:hypothetical protein
LTELVGHTPKLTRSELRASRVPWCTNSKDPKNETTCGSGGDDNVKSDGVVSKAIRDGHPLAMKVLTDGSYHPLLLRTGGGAPNRGLTNRRDATSEEDFVSLTTQTRMRKDTI